MPRLGEIVAHPRLDRAQVLPDHHRARAVRLQRQHADQRLVVVAHVGARLRRLPGRDPPQPEQPEDVIHPDPAGMPQHRGQHAAGTAGSPPRPAGRAATAAGSSPGRSGCSASGGAPTVTPCAKVVLQPPDVGAVRMHPDREVVHDAQPHPGADRRGLRAGSCSSSTHCSQRWKSTRRRAAPGTRPPPARPGACSSPGQPRESLPCVSASAHQAAKSRRPAPSRAR